MNQIVASAVIVAGRRMIAIALGGKPRARVSEHDMWIQLSSVRQILDAITAGDATLRETRQAIDTGLRQARIDQTGRCDGDNCRQCAANRDTVAARLAETIRRTRRADDPAKYPYAVSGRGVHTVRCPTDRCNWRVGMPLPVTEDELEWLIDDETRLHTHDSTGIKPLRYQPLSRVELQEWVSKRTGSRGGNRWRACRVCQPQL